MNKTLLLLFFLLNILMFSAYGSTSKAKIEDSRTTRRQKEPKSMHGMIVESSKPSAQRTYQGLHVVEHAMTSRKAKTVYGGGANNMRNPKKGKNSASSCSIKSSSLFMAALKHLFPGFLLAGCFF